MSKTPDIPLPPAGKYWYRYDEFWREADFTKGWNAQPTLEIILTTYRIERETAASVWIGGRKIGKDWRRQFACETQEKALISYRARKNHQLAYASKHFDTATKALELIEAGTYPTTPRSPFFQLE